MEDKITNPGRTRGLMLDSARLTERHDFYFQLLPFLARWGYNSLWWHFCDDEGCAIELESHPDLASPYAMSKRQTREFIQAASDVGIELVPEVETLGHSLWLTGKEKFAHLFDGMAYGHNAICPSHPETLEVLEPIISEVSELFESDYIHAGLDEAVVGDCQRCREAGAGKPDWWVFEQHVKAVYELVKASGKKMIMWADGVEKHPALLKRLPRDIIMAHWHYDHVPYEKIISSVEAGFEILCVPAVSGNLIQPNRERLSNVDEMAALAGQLSDSGCLGVVTAWWESFQVLRDTMYLGIAYAGQSVKSSSDIEPRAAIKKFTEDFFGSKEPAEPLWSALSVGFSPEECHSLFPDSLPDLLKSFQIVEKNNLEGRLSRTQAALKKLWENRGNVERNREKYDAYILAARIMETAFENALKINKAFKHYSQAERKASFMGASEEVFDLLWKSYGYLQSVSKSTKKVAEAASREWDRTRRENDPKKDNSSTLIRQRARKALLPALLRSKRFYSELEAIFRGSVKNFTSGGTFPCGIEYAPTST